MSRILQLYMHVFYVTTNYKSQSQQMVIFSIFILEPESKMNKTNIIMYIVLYEYMAKKSCLYANIVGSCTYEGENTVMMLQVAR
jgi:hypothetical protein